jgi:SAM-dependent methyltransferase
MGDTTTVPDFEEDSARAAESFAELDEVLWNPISTAAVSRSHPRFDERVLDAWCGDGASALPTAELVGTGGLVDAVDLAEPLIEIARERAGERMPQLHLHVADVTTWEPAEYDLVQCVLGLSMFPDLEADTRRLIERARPGGRVSITAWARGAIEPLPQVLAEALPEGGSRNRKKPKRPKKPPQPPKPKIEVADTAGTLAHWMTELGLVGVRAEAVQRHVDLEPDLAWQLVRGTRLRAVLADIEEAELDTVRERYLAALAEREVTSIDATTLIAVGHRPE